MPKELDSELFEIGSGLSFTGTQPEKDDDSSSSDTDGSYDLEVDDSDGSDEVSHDLQQQKKIDPYDKDLYKGEDDRLRLEKMDMLEREEIILRRSEKREGIRKYNEIIDKRLEKLRKIVPSSSSQDRLKSKRKTSTNRKTAKKPAAIAKKPKSAPKRPSVADYEEEYDEDDEFLNRSDDEEDDEYDEDRDAEDVEMEDADSKEDREGRDQHHPGRGGHRKSRRAEEDDDDFGVREKPKKKTTKSPSAGSSARGSRVSSSSRALAFLIEEIKDMSLRRSEMEEHYDKPYFPHFVRGLFVRVQVDPNQKSCYKLGEIVNVIKDGSQYIFKDRETSVNLVINLGNETRNFPLKDVSEGTIQNAEIQQWLSANRNAPTEQSFRRKKNQKTDFLEHRITAEEQEANQQKLEEKRERVSLADEYIRVKDEIERLRSLGDTEGLLIQEARLEEINRSIEEKSDIARIQKKRPVQILTPITELNEMKEYDANQIFRSMPPDFDFDKEFKIIPGEIVAPYPLISNRFVGQIRPEIVISYSDYAKELKNRK